MPLYRASTQTQVPSYLTPPYTTGIGAYYWTHIGTAATTGQTINTNGQIAMVPWIIPNAITLTQIGLDINAVTSVDTGGVARLGIYSDTGGYYPGSLIKDCGTILADNTVTPGVFFVTPFSLFLQPGIYWIALAMQGMATARPTLGTMALTGAPHLNPFVSTLNGLRVIPTAGSGMGRSIFVWTPSTTPAFTAVGTGFSVATPFTSTVGTLNNPWPRFAIRIA